MPREATITQEQVNAAADAIRAAGQQPTARAVRETLGTGSMATVLKFLQVWKAGQVKAAPADITLPPALARYLVEFVATEVAKGRAEVEAELVAAQQATADLIAESERQAGHIDALTAACDDLQGEKAEVTGRLAVMESDLAAARDSAQAAEQAAESARTELAKAQLRLESIPRLEAELERLRGELSAAVNRANAAEQAGAVAAEKARGLTDRLADVQAAAQEVPRMEAELERLRGELTAAVNRANAAEQAGAVAAEKARGLTDRLADVQAAAQEARAAAKAAAAEAAELRGKLKNSA